MIYPDEKIARQDIVEAGRRMYMRGYVCANDGNLSARLSDGTVIATPSGVSKGFMTEEMLIKLDLDGNVIAGELKPSSEIRMHLAIYRQSQELIAVCHAHPPVSAAFAAAGVALDKAFLQETALFMGVVPVAKYAAPGSAELADEAAKYCHDYHGALLEHHGAVTWGCSVMQSLFRLESVEYAATVALYSKMLGFTRTLNKRQIEELIGLRPKWGITASLGEFK